jgi:hypothetical protein
MSSLARRDARGLSLAEVVITLALFALTLAGVAGLWAKSQEAYFAGTEAAEVQQDLRAALDFMVREIRAVGRDATLCAFDFGAVGPGETGDCTVAKREACRCRINGGSTPCASTPYDSCGGVFAIPAAGATLTTLRIRSDRDDDAVVTLGTEEDVTYALAVGSPPCPPGVARCLTRQTGVTASALVAVDIASFALTYFPVPGYGPCAAVGGIVPEPCPPFALPLSQLDADRIGRIRIAVTASHSFAGDTVSRTLVTDVAIRSRL